MEEEFNRGFQDVSALLDLEEHLIFQHVDWIHPNRSRSYSANDMTRDIGTVLSVSAFFPMSFRITDTWNLFCHLQPLYSLAYPDGVYTPCLQFIDRNRGSSESKNIKLNLKLAKRKSYVISSVLKTLWFRIIHIQSRDPWINLNL